MNLPLLMAQSAVTAEQVAARAAEQEQAFGATVVFVLLMLVIFGYVLPFLIVLRHLFQLAGRPGKLAFIPVYNFIVLGDIAKAPGLALVVVVSMILSLVPIVIFGALPTFLITAALLVKKLFDQYDQTISFWVWLVFAPFIAVFKMKEVAFSGLLAIPTNAYVVPERQNQGVTVFGGAVTPTVTPEVPVPVTMAAPTPPVYSNPVPVISPLASPLLPVDEGEEDQGPLLPPAFTHGATPVPAETGPVYIPAPVTPEPIYQQVVDQQPLPAPIQNTPPSIPETQPDPGIQPLPPTAFVPSIEDAYMRPPITQSADPYAVAAQADIAAALQAPTEPELQYVTTTSASDDVAPAITGVSLADLDALYGHNTTPPISETPTEAPTIPPVTEPIAEPAEEFDASGLIDPATLAPPVVMQPDMPVAEAPPEDPEPIEPAAEPEPAEEPVPPTPEPETDYHDSDGVLHIDHHHDS